jgi:hypothetical protein
MSLMAATLVAAFFVGKVSAINLPPGPVTIAAHYGTEALFDFTLSGVPPGYDVGNNTYLGWCVELNNANNQAGDGRMAKLLSTLGNLPAPYSSKRWDKINYIINHKQGPWEEVQLAIWYYTEGGFTPDPATNTNAAAMVQAAEANGNGFVPGVGQVVGVIVWWQGVDSSLQGSMIEVPIINGQVPPGPNPPPGGTNTPPGTNVCSDRFTAGGFILKDGNKANFGIQGGYQNGRLWGGINFKDHGTGMHVRGRDCTSYTVVDANCRRATYDVTIDGVPGTATVRVCDYGEPGVADTVDITLSNGYSASGDLGGGGSGGGNVQLHKSKCKEPGGKGDKGNKGGKGKGKGKGGQH